MNYNTIVIGAGPAGMSAALYLKRAGLSVLLVDKDAPGGKILKTKTVSNYLGFGSINGADLALKMYEHIKENDIPFEFGEVKSIDKTDGYVVKFDNKEFKCENIVIATGKSIVRKDIFSDKSILGISSCAVCDGTLYRDKVVGVVGSNEEAINDALYLSDLCKKIYIFSPKKLDKNLLKENIVVIEEKKILSLNTEDKKIKGVVLSDNTEYQLDGLFISEGEKEEFSLLSGLELEKGYIKVDKNMKTNLPNVYACGDAIYKDYYQISIAVGEGAIAALNIKAGGKNGRN